MTFFYDKQLQFDMNKMKCVKYNDIATFMFNIDPKLGLNWKAELVK